MSKKYIYHGLTLKQSYIVKHALRDKPDKDIDELNVYEIVCENIQWFKDKYNITDKNITPYCIYTYRDEYCSYIGSLVSCDKSLADCTKHYNISRFGGIPLVGGDK